MYVVIFFCGLYTSRSEAASILNLSIASRASGTLIELLLRFVMFLHLLMICCSGSSSDLPSIVVLPTNTRLCLPIRGTNANFIELFTILSFHVHNSDMIVLYLMTQEIQFSSLSFLFLFNTKTDSQSGCRFLRAMQNRPPQTCGRRSFFMRSFAHMRSGAEKPSRSMHASSTPRVSSISAT